VRNVRYKDNPPLLKSEELYYQLMLKYYERVDKAAKERENPLALLHIYSNSPQDIEQLQKI